MGLVPLVNENDAVDCAEASSSGTSRRFGNNDLLASEVAVMLGADLLVFLSGIKGLYTAGKAHRCASFKRCFRATQHG